MWAFDAASRVASAPYGQAFTGGAGRPEAWRDMADTAGTAGTAGTADTAASIPADRRS